MSQAKFAKVTGISKATLFGAKSAVYLALTAVLLQDGQT